jgi:glutathione S-transferase
MGALARPAACKLATPHSPTHHTHTSIPTRELFGALDRVEGMLGGSRYLLGDSLTEADVRLFMTLIRFDEVSLKRGDSTRATQLYLRELSRGGAAGSSSS